MKKAPILYRSQKLSSLAERLIEELEGGSPLENRIVLVPNSSVKQWLSLEIARKKGIFMGLELLSVQEGFGRLLPPSLNSLELFCLVYDALRHSKDPGLLAYLDGKKKRLSDLSQLLSSLFFRYGRYGEGVFKKRSNPDWQEKILQDLFIEGPWRLPIQQLKEAPPPADPIHCFGVDALPPAFWEFLFQAPSLCVYSFSPCAEYWGDLSTEGEKRALLKKKKVSTEIRRRLEEFFKEAPPLLASWGKLGRETNRILDGFETVEKEAYADSDEGSLLKRIQNGILSFDNPGEKFRADDESLLVLQAGSSRLREVEILRDQILKEAGRGVLFQEMSVLAPDIEPYIPLVEFVFSEAQIPFRIQGHDLGRQSSYYQGLLRLLKLAGGRWDAEEVLTLFETPSFYRKQGWDEDKREQVRTWVRETGIAWGKDEGHRRTALSETVGAQSGLTRGTWEEGLDRFLEDWIFLFPEGRRLEVEAEPFASLLAVYESLKRDLAEFRSEASLHVWAERLEITADRYLSLDSDDESDASFYSAFQRVVRDLRKADLELSGRQFPFEVLQRFLSRSFPGQIHASHLHAVRFAPLDEGALIPARALFLIGLDEESFPRLPMHSSLDLLRKEKISVPEIAEQDRYLFLQALFAASESVRISYGHLSPDEGKPVNPSIVVQEWLNQIENPPIETPPSSPFDPKCFEPGEVQSRSYTDYRIAERLLGPKRKLSFWPDLSQLPPFEMPQGEKIVSISDLAAFVRHPWRYFLQKMHGMYLNESLEETFSLQKKMLARAFFSNPSERALEELPQGILGLSLRKEIEETAHHWRSELKKLGVEQTFSIHLRERCKEQKWESENHLAAPPVEVLWEGKLKVSLVGEIRQAAAKGMVHFGRNQIDSLLKIWPEALAAASVLGSSEIFLAEEGKSKQIEDPEGSLKRLLEYYFRCRAVPSPLLSKWADGLLRRGSEAMTAKSDRHAFEDPVFEWVKKRTELPEAETIHEVWSGYLREAFSSLSALFPTRTKKEDADAAV